MSQVNGDEKIATEHGIEPAANEEIYPAVKVASESAVKEGERTRTVQNAELYAALQESPIDPKSRTSIHLYWSIFISFCCACANGYDGSLMTAIIDMPAFQKTFNTGGSTGSKISVIMSLYTVGSMVGAPVAAVCADKLGRRKSMFLGSWVIILGMVLVASASTMAQFVVGRFVLGLGIAVMTVCAPAYSMEIAPPNWRGRCTGFYNCGWFGGSIPAAAITFGTSYIDGNLSWRLPLIFQAFACLIVVASCFLIPESPRWQLANGKSEEAKAFLIKYHGNGDPNSRLVRLELEEMMEGIRLDGIDKNPWDYRPFVTTHYGRWRLAQVLMIGIFGQFSGNGLGYFNTVIFGLIGVDTEAAQLGYNLLNQCLSAVGALTAMSFTDRMPRRKVLVYGTMCCVIWLTLNAAFADKIQQERGPDKTGVVTMSYARAALATYFMFNFTFSFAYTPLQGVVPVEALETTMRAKGLALYGFVVSAFGFINQFAGPIALQNIANNYIWVFVGWDVIETICWYFFGVESQGRTLEQLEWVYDQPNPVKASLKADKIVLDESGHVKEKIVTDSA